MALTIGRKKGPQPERDPEGRMTLGEHLRELRSRLFKSALGLLVGGAIGFVFRNQIIGYFRDILKDAAEAKGVDAVLNYAEITDSLFAPLRVAFLAGIVIGAPVWIYQAWEFVTPALYQKERRWAAMVIGAAVPLFLAGVGLAIWVLPIATEFLFEFQTEGIDNTVAFSGFLSFATRVVLVFGIAFLLPIFVVLLNAAGVVQHETLSNARRWVIVGIFVFGAIATPTGDPLTLMLLATPMWLLFEAAVLVCRFNDRRRAKQFAGGVGTDEATPDEILGQLGRRDDDDT